MHPVITASVPLLEPPGWATAQRELFDLLDRAWRRFARDFTGPDGRLRYTGELTSRDGVDDFYEVFFNWPQLYLLGGADDLLDQCEHHWEGVTRQLTELGMLKDEYERGYDWFHQGESLLLLYFLCMAAPDRWAERARRFADLYVDPGHGNYDPDRRIIRRPHNGSDPGRDGLSDGGSYPWLPKEARMYGFPLNWILPAGAEPPPLEADPRLGAEMRRRMGEGDTAVNLSAAGLVLNAWIISGSSATPTGSPSTWAPGGSAPPPTGACCPTTWHPTGPSAGCWTAAGTAATTAGAGRTAGTAWGMRRSSRPWRAPRSAATTPTWTWCARSWTRSSRRAR